MESRPPQQASFNPWSLQRQIDRAQQQLLIYDLDEQTLRALEHPDGTFYSPELPASCRFTGATEILTRWVDATHPPQLITLDPASGALKQTLLSSGQAPASRPSRSVTFRSSDGQEVQGWLALPDGAGPFPAVIHVHGGPHLATLNHFNPFCQSWLDHGFAYLDLNYRGSTTFGRAFKEHIWGNVGYWELQDMAAGRQWLVEQGVARADAVFVTGESYGGFLTLLALGRQPELWAGGMAVVAIADWLINYEDASDALKGACAAWHGGTPAEQRERYIASSPITYAEHVRAPLLIIQGRNDSRTTARQIEHYEARMRALGKSIEVVWFDAGHGVGGIEELIAFQERMLAFAQQVVGS